MVARVSSAALLVCCASGACRGYDPDALRDVFTTRAVVFRRTAGRREVVEVDLCGPCWRQAGEPSAPPSTAAEAHAAALKARDRMQARGGTDRHMVRSGKAGL